MNERQKIDAAQAALEVVKSNLRDIMKINRDAGRHREANAVFLSLAELNVWHGNVTERLYEHFPDHAGGVVAQGGGGR